MVGLVNDALRSLVIIFQIHRPNGKYAIPSASVFWGLFRFKFRACSQIRVDCLASRPDPATVCVISGNNHLGNPSRLLCRVIKSVLLEGNCADEWGYEGVGLANVDCGLGKENIFGCVL